MLLPTMPLTMADHALVKLTHETLQKNLIPDKRFVATAIRTTSGETITALNIRAYLGRASVCAEPIALASILNDSTAQPETLVTICHPGFVTTPCGICRELLIDYCPDLMIILPIEGKLQKCFIKDLMPMKFYGLSKNCFKEQTSAIEYSIQVL